MSSQDTTVSEFIVNELTEEKLKELEDTSQIPANQLFFTNSTEGECYNGLPLGTILSMAIETDSIYLKKLDGGCINIYGIYKTFCDLIINSYTNNPSSVPVCDIGEYATEMETYGQCGKFVINKTGTTLYSGNYSVEGNSIKLPTITEFIASSNGGDTIGLAELDEFKRHAHKLNDRQQWYGDDTVVNSNTGAIYSWKSSAGGTTSASYASSRGEDTTEKGGSETRPKNIRYPYYIVVLSSQLGEALLKDLILQNSKSVKLLYEKGRIDLPISSATGGIAGTNSITLPDNMEDYKTLIIYCTFANVPHMYTIDLTTKNTCGYLTNYPYAGGGTLTGLDDIMAGSSTAGIFFSFIGINEGKTNLTHIHTGFTSGATITFRDTNTGYIIYKIEGILTDEAIKRNLNITTNILDLENITREEIIYDKDSPYASINFNYKDGIINNGSSIFTDLTKYKRLIVTVSSSIGYRSTVMTLDLTSTLDAGAYYTTCGEFLESAPGSNTYTYIACCHVDPAKTKFAHLVGLGRSHEGNSFEEGAGAYRVTKIVGIY